MTAAVDPVGGLERGGEGGCIKRCGVADPMWICQKFA